MKKIFTFVILLLISNSIFSYDMENKKLIVYKENNDTIIYFFPQNDNYLMKRRNVLKRKNEFQNMNVNKPEYIDITYCFNRWVADGERFKQRLEYDELVDGFKINIKNNNEMNIYFYFTDNTKTDTPIFDKAYNIKLENKFATIYSGDKIETVDKKEITFELEPNRYKDITIKPYTKSSFTIEPSNIYLSLIAELFNRYKDKEFYEKYINVFKLSSNNPFDKEEIDTKLENARNSLYNQVIEKAKTKDFDKIRGNIKTFVTFKDYNYKSNKITFKIEEKSSTVAPLYSGRSGFTAKLDGMSEYNNVIYKIAKANGVNYIELQPDTDIFFEVHQNNNYSLVFDVDMPSAIGKQLYEKAIKDGKLKDGKPYFSMELILAPNSNIQCYFTPLSREHKGNTIDFKVEKYIIRDADTFEDLYKSK